MPVTYPGEEPIFIGQVLAKREHNGYHDSDFYVIAWNGKQLVQHEYDSTRYAGSGARVIVDATDEVKQEVNKWVYHQMRKRIFNNYLNEINKPQKGDIVEVVKGRKVTKGSIGILFYIGDARSYGYRQQPSESIGIALSDRRNDRGQYIDVAWTYMKNVKVVGCPRFKYSELKWRLKSLKHAGWRGYYAYLYSGLGKIFI
jgi:hypothetical protein